MKYLYKKEINYYLNNPIGYVTVILFAVFANFFFVKDIFVVGSASMKPFFNFIPWLLLIFIPAISMRIFADEKKTNTIETLLTLPISETEIVIAKFMALTTIMIISLSLTFGLPISLLFFAKIYYPEIIIGYFGVFLLSLSFISLSTFFSNQTKNQIIAFLISTIMIFLLLVLSTDITASVLPKFVQDGMVTLTPFYHLKNFIKGIIDIRSVFYFVSFTCVFLFLTIVDLEKRN